MENKISKVLIAGLSLILVTAAVPSMAACAVQAPPTSTPGAVEVKLYSGPLRGAAYALSYCWSQLLKEHSTWLRASAVETSSETESLSLTLYIPENRANSVCSASFDDIITFNRRRVNPYKCPTIDRYPFNGFIA